MPSVDQGVVTGALGERDVEGAAFAFAEAALAGGPGAGVEGPAVAAGDVDVGAAFEHRLGAVAVVDVLVEDQDPLAAELADGVVGGQGDVVEQAEAHGPVGLGVVAGRPDQGQGLGRLAADHGLGGAGRGAGREAGAGPGALVGGGVAVELAAVLVGRVLEPVQVGRPVQPHQLARIRQRRLLVDEPRQPGRVQRRVHRPQPLRPLRVPGAGVVQQEAVIAEDEHETTKRGQTSIENRGTTSKNNRCLTPLVPGGDGIAEVAVVLAVAGGAAEDLEDALGAGALVEDLEQGLLLLDAVG